MNQENTEKKLNFSNVQIRVLNDEVEILKLASKIASMPLSTFLRSCAMRQARRDIDLFEKEKNQREDNGTKKE
jgi:uncharacterized protein (DUF1778 family)